jgi:hypothetical protein
VLLPNNDVSNPIQDIIPKYGFIHKPSPLWPLPAIAESVVARATHPSDPIPVIQEIHGQIVQDFSAITGENVSHLRAERQPVGGDTSVDAMMATVKVSQDTDLGRPIRVKMDNADAEPMELRSQIQLYATNELSSALLLRAAFDATPPVNLRIRSSHPCCRAHLVACARFIFLRVNVRCFVMR